MSMNGEAAEQVVNMATNLTVKGVECVANLTGKGAVSLATFLLAAIKDEKRTKGKVRMQYFNGKPTKVFVIRSEDFKQFAQEAKANGILYAAAFNKKNTDGLINVVVHANDAARVNRIAETFALSSEEVDKLRAEILKARKENGSAEKERTTPPAEKRHTVDDKTINKMLAATAPRQTHHKQPVEIGDKKANPTMARTTRSHPSAPSSASSKDTARASSKERPSVKAQIKEIRAERRENSQQSPAPSKTRQTQHKQPRKTKNTKSKER